MILILTLLFISINFASSADNSTFTNNSDSKYLQSTKNCQSDSKIIKDLTKTVTKSNKKYKTFNSTKIKREKAIKIFNYVNKQKSYSFYYNTKYGAKNLVKKSSGNCVDKSHLLIAMMRSAKIPARYVHAKVTMISGRIYGHVYAEVKIGNKWFLADPTHRTLNKFGKVGNWKKSKIIKRQIGLSF